MQDRGGVTSCFNCIIEAHQSQAFNLACRMLDDRTLAEDAVQESLVSAYRSFHQFRGDNLAAWLMRIVANRCRDLHRRRRARPTLSLESLSGEGDNPDADLPAPELPSTGESPEDYVQRRELDRAIRSGLASLPGEHRMAVLLVDVQGFSYEEASRIMDCSLGTVKSRVSRGRSRLRGLPEKPGGTIAVPVSSRRVES